MLRTNFCLDPMRGRYLDDFTVGEILTTEPVRLDAEEIMAFGRRWDPQPLHTDIAAAAEGPYGGLIASGFHTIAVGFTQFVRTGFLDGTSLGGPGMDEVRWTAPVRPGDTLTTEIEVLEARPSRSKPDRGVLRLAFTMRNQAGEVAVRFQGTTILRRRPDA